MYKKSFKGFTLVELVVVIAIIGVLASILVPNMMGYVRKSKYTKANSNARSIYNVLLTNAMGQDLSGNNLGSFTINPQDMNTWISGLNLSAGQQDELSGGMGGYISMKYDGGYPTIVAWGENGDFDAVIGRYPNPTNSEMNITWYNVLN
ncbi:MAG: type II secretion system protein [Oscillospiraceae bacterium]